MIRVTPGRLALLVAVVMLVAVTAPAIREFFAVDACLDSGGVYDYASGQCRHDVQRLPFAPRPWLEVPNHTAAEQPDGADVRPTT